MNVLQKHRIGSVQRAICTIFLLFFTVQVSFAQSFSISKLKGAHLVQPTSLQFGLDQKLYVAQQRGLIKVYDIVRLGENNYQATITDSITLIGEIENHYDDGTVYNVSSPFRQVTGIYVAGTIANPIIYVSSSDFRQGGGGSASDINLDTNSGIISKLTWNGTAWEMVHLVRGLPRSEENHATNGLYYNQSTNTLYVAQGGNTNAGGPSNNFAFLTEYALSAAILEIDLSAIEALSIQTDTSSGEEYYYDLPTTDDPTRANANGIDDPNISGYDGVDLHDPFGGADGLNQAKWVENGPVQIFASGFRNAYDLVYTDAGKLYTWDNGANVGWGGHPAKEGGDTTTNNWVVGEPGSSTAGPNDAVVNNEDGFHLISGSNYYGGHPNPVRANPSGAGIFTHDDQMSGGANGTFRTSYDSLDQDLSLPYDWPPLPVSFANPVEGDFQNPGIDNSSLYNHEASTNGLVEYKATNFGGVMQGDILAVSFNNKMFRVHLNANGTINSAADVTELATGFGIVPLDVTTTDDLSAFQGNIWVADVIMDSIIIFEPQDFSACTGADDSMIDEDNDGYSNADEIDNDTDPCNGASLPQDFDQTLIGGFKVSDLNDPDDDDDGILDDEDYFVWDATNGLNLSIPFDYPLLNGDPGTGLYGVGFTGFMSNGVDDYLELWKTEENSDVEIVAGGAVGLFSINNITNGDALGSLNDQHNGFQFGVAVSQGTPPFVIEAGMLGPLFLDTIIDVMTAGVFIGVGDQDNYLKIGFHSNGGMPRIRVTEEIDGVASSNQYTVTNLEMAADIKFYLEVFPDDGMVQPKYAIGLDAPTSLGSPITLSGDLLTTLQSADALAIGIISTSRATDSTFNATWDDIKVDYLPLSAIGQWIEINDGTSCAAEGAAGSCIEGRHENAFVQVGELFYALGGRENNSNVNIYNPATDSWTVGADAPILLHHFQGVVYDNMIWVVGAFTGNFPNETAVSNIYIYDPNADTWHVGPEIPASRRRGAGGAQIYNDKIYMVGGIQLGHTSGWVSWLDEYNPQNNTWTALTDATRSRDHFQATVAGDEMFLIGGRRTNEFGNVFLPVEQMVDVYDFTTGAWDTLTTLLPTGRGGTSSALLGDEIFVIGGETSSSSTGLATTQALDLSMDTWRNVASLNEGRHGTQAIVNNGGIYVAGGSPDQGDGSMQSYEGYYLFGQTSPILNSYNASNLITTVDTLDYGEVLSNDTSTLSVTYTNASPDQGVLIESIEIENLIDYAFSTNISLPYFLRPGKSFTVNVEYHPDGNDIDLSVLKVTHSGTSQETLVFLISNGALQPPGFFINCGGPSVILNGVYWQADEYFSSGTSVFTNLIEILATDEDTLYQTARFKSSDFTYDIPIDTNWYDLNLHLAELEFVDNGTAGYAQFARKFDLFVEGELEINNLNINTLNAPEEDAKAVVVSVPIRSLDGTLNILFDKENEEAWINAISITPRECPPADEICNDLNPYTFNDVTDGYCGCSGEVQEYIWLEAECGTVGSLWTIQNASSQSNGKVLKPPSSSGISGANSNPNALVVIPFVTSETGTFKVHGRVKTASSSSDSYWIAVDNSSWSSWNRINADPYTNTYEWDEVHHYLSGPGIIPVSYDLEPGQHTLYVSYREANSRLDQFFITNTDSIPQGIQVEGANCGDCTSNNSFSELEVPLCSGDSILIGGEYQDTPGVYVDSLTSSDGCDSLLIITLFAADTFYNYDTLTICSNDSMFLGGNWQNTANTYVDTLASQYGCDSVIETLLKVNPAFIDTTIMEICAGDSALLGGAYQYNGGIYLDSFVNQFGCDSVWATNLSILDTSYTYLRYDICEGDSILINGLYRFSDSIFIDKLVNVFGCDSVVVQDLDVEENVPTNVLHNICPGDSVLTDGGYVMNEGMYNDTLTSDLGCDSIVISTVSFWPVYRDTLLIKICEGDSIFSDGTWQFVDGFYTDSLTTENGCDSIQVTELAVEENIPTNVQYNICPGDSVLTDGGYVMAEGMYNDTLTSDLGCDSIVISMVSFWPVYRDTLLIEICEGDSIFSEGAWQLVDGFYTDSLTTENGCDSIQVTELDVEENIPTNVLNNICPGDSVLTDGGYVMAEGMYNDTLTSDLGCDSIVISMVSFWPVYRDTLLIEICEGDSIFSEGAWQFVDGFYTDSLTTENGCDSIQVTELAVEENIPTNVLHSICPGDSVLTDGGYVMNEGMYNDTLTSDLGCDSIVISMVSFWPVYRDTILIKICEGDSIFSQGAWQLVDGFYTDSLTTENACDSIQVTELDVEENIPTNVLHSICPGDSVLTNGGYVMAEGMYNDTLTSDLGCDSIVISTVSFWQVYRDTILIKICEGDSIFTEGSWQLVDGFYTDSLTTENGCDSIQVSELSVEEQFIRTDQYQICEGDSIVLTNFSVKESGIYRDTFMNMLGCDSIVIADVTVNANYRDTVQLEICTWDSLELNGEMHSSSGFYSDTLSAATGCDSIKVFDLVVLDSCVWPGGVIVFVDSAATGMNNGYSWVDAFVDIQSGLAIDSLYDNINQIWVARGTYSPTQGSSRDASFVLRDSTELYGSFIGTENLLEQRDTTIITTILSGDIGVIGDSTDNSYQVVEIASSAIQVKLDGVQIQSATSNGLSRNAFGGAILNEGIAHVKHIKVLDMSSTLGGRVIHVSGPSAILTLEKALIIDPGPESIHSINGATIIFKGLVEIFK